MHNGKAVWDGHSPEPASVQWQVDFSASASVTKSADFNIAPGDSAADVAENLSVAWNTANPTYPSVRTGTTVDFQPAISCPDVVGMRFILNKRIMRRVPAVSVEVEVVDGLFVYRSA